MFTSANIATARCGQKGKEIFGNQDNVLRGQVESYIHILGAGLINIMFKDYQASFKYQFREVDAYECPKDSIRGPNS